MRNIRAWLAKQSMEELAARYVQIEPRTADITNGQVLDAKIPGKLYTAWDLRQEMQRRAGLKHSQTYIHQAREAFNILGGNQ